MQGENSKIGNSVCVTVFIEGMLLFPFSCNHREGKLNLLC